MRELHSRGFAIATVMLLILGSMIILFGSGNAAGEDRDNEIKITWGGLRQWHPSVFGDKITWQSDYGDIFIYDAKTTEVRRESLGFSAYRSDIYGKYIVYEDSRAGSSNWDIYLLDTETGTEYHMFDGSDSQRIPRIWGDHIVWTEKDGDHWKVAYTTVHSSIYYFFNYDDSNQSNPDVCGRKLVYQDDSNGNWDIYYRDFADRAEVPITTNSHDQISPRIHGDKVVWTDYRNGDDNTDIYMYDLLTKTESQITFDTSHQRCPVIFNDIIVWQDYRKGNWDIFMMDLNDGVPIQVTTNTSDQVFPDVYGDIIVWEDRRIEAALSYDNYNIFMTYIDRDGDTIYDWDDPQPTIPHFPLESLEYKMDMLMVQLKLTEENLTSRVQSLRAEMTAGFDDLKDDIIGQVEEGVDEILADLDAHDNTLWGTNNTIHMEFTALKDDLISLRENLTTKEKEIDLLSGYLETLEELILQVRASIELSISEMGTSASNTSLKIDEIRISLDELQKLDDMVTDLETISKDVDQIQNDVEEEPFGLFEILTVILLGSILFLVFLGLFRRRNPQNSSYYEE